MLWLSRPPFLWGLGKGYDPDEMMASNPSNPLKPELNQLAGPNPRSAAEQGDSFMNGQIPWWQSRTIWFGLIQAGIGLAVAFGLFSNEQGSAMAGYADQILGVVMTALAAAQVQGRATATKEIKPNIVPPANPSEPTGTA